MLDLRGFQLAQKLPEQINDLSWGLTVINFDGI
jgi:hypothetical protein